MFEVFEPVEAVVSDPSGTVVVPNVNVRVSSTDAVTVTNPAVEVATVPLSIVVVQAASEYVVIRIKNVAFVALRFVTFENVTVCGLVGAVTLALLEIRRAPLSLVLFVHPVRLPMPVGWLANVEAALENPTGVVHAPFAVVQARNSAERIIVADGTLKTNEYVVFTPAAELPIVTDRPVI